MSAVQARTHGGERRRAAVIHAALGLALAALASGCRRGERDELAPGIRALAITLDEPRTPDAAAQELASRSDAPVPDWIRVLVDERRRAGDEPGAPAGEAAAKTVEAAFGPGKLVKAIHDLGKDASLAMGADLILQAVQAPQKVGQALDASEQAALEQSRLAAEARRGALLDGWSDEAGYRYVLAALSSGAERGAALGVSLATPAELAAPDEQVSWIDGAWLTLVRWQGEGYDRPLPKVARGAGRSWQALLLGVRNGLESWATGLGVPPRAAWPRPPDAPLPTKFQDRIQLAARHALTDVFALVTLTYEGGVRRCALFRKEQVPARGSLELSVPGAEVLLSVEVLLRADEGWARLPSGDLGASNPYVKWLAQAFHAAVATCRLEDAEARLAALERIDRIAPARAEERAELEAARRCEREVRAASAALAERGGLPKPAREALQARIAAAERLRSACPACSLGELPARLTEALAWIERDEAFQSGARAALAAAPELVTLGAAFAAWRPMAAAYDALGTPSAGQPIPKQPIPEQPIPEQVERFDAVTEALARSAAKAFDATQRGAVLAAELEALDRWIRGASCKRLAGLSRAVHERLAESVLAELEASRTLGLGDLRPALRDASLLTERHVCGEPDPERRRALVTECVAVVRAQLPPAPTAEAALRWLLELDRAAQALGDGAVQWAILEAPRELFDAVAQALADGGSLQKDLGAYGALATLTSESPFRLLSARILELVAPIEERIRARAMHGDGLAERSGNWIRIERFARTLPGPCLLDGSESGRVVTWVNELMNALDRAIVELSDESIGEIEGALQRGAWRRAESLARELDGRALPGSRVSWIAKTLQGLAILGDGKPERLVAADHLFEEVVQGTEGTNDVAPDGTRARAATGWARICALQAHGSLDDARLAIPRGDWRRLQTEGSNFVAAVASAEKALAVALSCGTPASAQEVRADLDDLIKNWNTDVVPALQGVR